MRKKVEIVTIALSSPLLVGVYENAQLIEVIQSEEKSSDALPIIFEQLLQKYELQGLFYANGPGSFMAIKVSYIFLKSLSILKKVPLYATDAFYFNGNQPIKAIGKLHFVKIHDTIKTEKLDDVVKSSFTLPQTLHVEDFTKESAPMYGIGAV